MSENLKKLDRMLEKFTDLVAMAVLAGVQIGFALITLFVAVKFVGVYSELAGGMILFFAFVTQSVMKAQFDREFSILEAHYPLFLVWVVAQLTGEHSSMFAFSKILPLTIGVSVATYVAQTLIRMLIWFCKIPLQTVVNKVAEANREDMPKAKNQAVRLAEMTADEYDMVVEEIIAEQQRRLYKIQ